IFGQWLHIRVEASEQEATIGLEPRNLLQIVRASAVELLGVTGAVGIFHLQQLAGIAECPTVKRAGKCRFATALVTAKHCATMTAGIDEGVKLVVLAAGDKDGLSSHPGCEIVVLVRNLTLMREIHPVSLKQVLHLQLKEPCIGKYRTIATKQTVGRILDQCCVETFNDACCHGLFSQKCHALRSPRSVEESVKRAAMSLLRAAPIRDLLQDK